MKPYKERHYNAQQAHNAGLRRVITTPAPKGQKFQYGSRVKIADNLGPYMSHFPSGKNATVVHSYAHAYGGNDVGHYCLNVDGIGCVAWYLEEQLTLLET